MSTDTPPQSWMVAQAMDRVAAKYNDSELGNKRFTFDPPQEYQGSINPCAAVFLLGLSVRAELGGIDPIILFTNSSCPAIGGIWLSPSRTIIIFTAGSYSPDYLEAIVSHEIGHFYQGHEDESETVMSRDGIITPVWSNRFRTAVRTGTITDSWPFPSRAWW
jgi:Zn-dependent protease with chaperone function